MTDRSTAALVSTVDSIATANPPFTASQAEVAQFMLRVSSLSEGVRNKLTRIYERSGIDRRYSCVADYARRFPDFDFFPRNENLAPPPTTAARNRIYREWAPKIAYEAARDALAQASATPSSITHIIVVSCTGFFAPGVDFHLIRSLGLSATVARTTIGFMGCYAAFNGLKAADAIGKSTPGARVLVVCVELCTLHLAIEDSLESAVINAIFADGAAAAVISSATRDEAAGRMTIADSRSVIAADSLGDMTWDIGDTGFAMSLSPRVPGIVARHLPAYVDDLLAANYLTRADIDRWAIHPGGRQVVDKAREALGLTADEAFDSYEVLRQFGNMSSATILFILRRMLAQRDTPSPGETPLKTIVAMGFGPGLAIEGCLLREG